MDLKKESPKGSCGSGFWISGSEQVVFSSPAVDQAGDSTLGNCRRQVKETRHPLPGLWKSSVERSLFNVDIYQGVVSLVPLCSFHLKTALETKTLLK